MTVRTSKPAINLREKLSELEFDRVPFQKMPAGSVLQVVNTYTLSYITTSSTTFIGTGLSLNITPSSTSSQILVSVNLNGINVSGGNGHFALYVNGSLLQYLSSSVSYYATTNETNSVSYQYLHSPNSTVQQTYEIYFKNSTGAIVRLNDYTDGTVREHSSITLMEIAA